MDLVIQNSLQKQVGFDTGGNTELLYRLINAGSEFRARDPTDVTGLPKVYIVPQRTHQNYCFMKS